MALSASLGDCLTTKSTITIAELMTKNGIIVVDPVSLCSNIILTEPSL